MGGVWEGEVEMGVGLGVEGWMGLKSGGFCWGRGGIGWEGRMVSR